ncbi:protein of unknown function [Pseudodesulfovibrio profundus]|uniref:Uncharacterized protein n=1 Tax=Pseudodesulfovibrio profundus TaxID=57320 RepID=A0A2C8FFI8_9BACT|nr:protein of unknown function [Pseudodesulfovibrio profundus]
MCQNIGGIVVRNADTIQTQRTGIGKDLSYGHTTAIRDIGMNMGIDKHGDGLSS